jgi:thioredoxin 1
MQELTDASFDGEVLAPGRPMVVDFWAPWCGPCRAIHPILEQLEEQSGGAVAFGRLNVDEHPEVAARYGVLSLPTVILFEGGEAKETVIGARPRGHFERAFAAWLETPA